MMPAVKQQNELTLRDLLDGFVDESVLAGIGDIAVTGIAQDSRQVRDNDVFFAIRGATAHGLEFAEQAVRSGASVILWDASDSGCSELLDAVDDQVTCVAIDGLQRKIGAIASRFYGHPSRDLYLVGVTGTDGKTSVSHYLAQCLNTEDAPCGVLGTLGNGLIDALAPTGLTTASAVQVQQSLAGLREQGARSAAMEVSSHGLDQGRVYGVAFDTAVFTNLSQDHLDYHKTMEAYFEAKAKLFESEGLKSAVINLDDEFGRMLAQRYRNRLTVYGYSTSSDVASLEPYADFIVYAKSIEPTAHGFDINVVTPKGAGYFALNLLGKFNVANSLAVLATLLLNNVAFEEALKRLQALRPVGGRMELVTDDDMPTVIVDYAHTPQGIAAACNAARLHFRGELWCVFGCGGDRDREKRPLMARAAEHVADHIVVTSDNPRHEDPQGIIDQIIAGFSRPQSVITRVDRGEAIEYAITHAAADDVILIAGKGHESCQIIGSRYISFDDRDVARACLHQRRTGVNK